MSVDLQNYNPMYMLDPEDHAPRFVVTAEEWNMLFNLLTAQGNNTAEAMYTLLNKLKTELWSEDAAQYIKSPIAMADYTTVSGQLAYLLNMYINHQRSADHDLRYYTKAELSQYLQGGDTSIGEEVFTIINSNNGDGTFTYNDGTADIIGTLTPEGYQVFSLTQGTYDVGQHRIEATINDTLHRSAASGGLVEIDDRHIALAAPEGPGAEITFKYYERISLGGEQSIQLSVVQPPQTANRSILWFKILD